MIERKGTATDVQVLDRAFWLIDIISERGTDMSIAEITEKSGLNRSTAYRLAESLTAHGYLEKTENGHYRLGMRVVSLAGCYINNLDLISVAQPFLWDMAYKFGLTCYMAVLSGTEIVYVARADSFRRGSVFMEIGWRVPAFATALGWCLLSQFPIHVLESMMGDVEYKQFAQNTVKNFGDLATCLRKTRQDGYAYEVDGFQDGNCCVAVPVYNYCGEIIAALSISGLKENFTDQKREEAIAYIQNIGMQISQKMGYSESVN